MNLSLWLNRYVIIVTIIRVGGYVYMLFNPILGILLSMLFDMLDWVILSYGKLKLSDYHKIDKPLDYLQYLFLIPILYNTPIFTIYLLLLAYRTFGTILISIYKDRRLFLLFPNFAEYYALAYLIVEQFNLNFNINSFSFIIPLIAFKLFQEYWIHIKSKSYSWFIGGAIRNYFKKFNII